MLNTSPMTLIQRETLDFISQFLSKNGYSPTLKEIAEGMGGKSIPTIHQHVEALRNKGYISKKDNAPRSMIAETEELSTIPLSGTIAAGSPIAVFEDPIPIQVPKSLVPQQDSHYALQISGDSMIEEGILDKDIVIIRHQNAANPGDIVVAVITDDYGNESATLKSYFPRANYVELRPKNPNYQPIQVRPDKLQIRGVFRGLIRKSSN